jgi:hypothetical protein
MTDGNAKTYTDRELDTHFSNLKEHMFGFEKDMRDVRGAILEQAKKTNGRVSKLESWRAYLTGGLAVLSLIVTILLAFAGVLASAGKL